MLDLQTAKDRRLREGSGYFWINIQQRLFSKERMKRTDEELDRLCKIEKVRRNPEDLKILANKGLQEAECSAHFEDRTPRGTHILLNLVVWPVHAWALNNHARMRGLKSSHVNHTCDVWSGLLHCASKTPLHPWCLIPIFSVFILSHSPRFALHHLNHFRWDALRFRRGHRWQEKRIHSSATPLEGQSCYLADSFALDRLWAQDLHRRQQWAHSDQLRLQKEDLQHWG